MSAKNLSAINHFTSSASYTKANRLCLRYKVISWRIKFEPTTKTTSYDITFQRLPMQASMEAVLARPMTEEAEDYREYKRIRKQMQGDLTPKLPSSANALLSMDGENDIQNASAADLVAVDSGVDIFHLSEEG